MYKLIWVRALFLFASACLLAYLSLGSNQGGLLIAPVADYGHYFFIGICAAVIANATGAGGGANSCSIAASSASRSTGFTSTAGSSHHFLLAITKLTRSRSSRTV